MDNLIQRINQYAMGGLKELSEHPIKTSREALTSLVKDYWDAGLAVASGLAWTPYGNEIYDPEVQGYLAFYGPVMSGVMGGLMHLRDREKAADRATRNGLVVASTMSIGNSPLSSGKFDLLSNLSGIFGVGYATVAGFMEFMRKTAHINTDSTKTLTLENQVS